MDDYETFRETHLWLNPNAAVKNMEDIIMTKVLVMMGIRNFHNIWRGSKRGTLSLARALNARENSSNYTIMSNRHKSIIEALKNVVPQTSRRICVLYFYKNFAANYHGAWFHYIFCIAANTYSSFVYLKAMDKIKKKEHVVYHWLRDSEPLEHWARFKFDTNLKFDDNTNNFAESFNNAITKLKGKPMSTMLEDIGKVVGAKFIERMHLVGRERSHHLLKKKKLTLIEEEFRNYLSVVHTGKGDFDVVEGCINFTVKLRDQFCNCKR
ncbi:LOW QUALITY PROTEIN: hypothetical protein Cgig2_015060 [Carnegiea gigantea]|uniref:Uncharacterized protein n=1 Tax=Carnegiea gigantea TaxID=171969 RepID=A0A9Q1K5Q6_9CARY|nr:LOW QUALITY PROTEIN: hypothetical protein Cgig2_015060 [Carnegiea gigantea]